MMKKSCPTKPQLIAMLAEDRVRRYPSYRGHEDDAVYFVKHHMGKTKRDLMLAAVNYKLVPESCWGWDKPGLGAQRKQEAKAPVCVRRERDKCVEWRVDGHRVLIWDDLGRRKKRGRRSAP
jgi:hypothetical protein